MSEEKTNVKLTKLGVAFMTVGQAFSNPDTQTLVTGIAMGAGFCGIIIGFILGKVF